MQARRQMTSLWTSAKLKPALFRANTLHNRFFLEPLTVYWGKHVVLRHFHRSHLKAKKVSKSEGTTTVKYAYYFWNCADAVDRKLSKLVHACRSYSLLKLAHFFEKQCTSEDIKHITLTVQSGTEKSGPPVCEHNVALPMALYKYVYDYINCCWRMVLFS